MAPTRIYKTLQSEDLSCDIHMVTIKSNGEGPVLGFIGLWVLWRKDAAGEGGWVRDASEARGRMSVRRRFATPVGRHGKRKEPAMEWGSFEATHYATNCLMMELRSMTRRTA